MRYVELNGWKRKAHYEFFSGMDYPQYNVCANVDATALRRYVKSRGISFYHTVVYASTLAANAVEEFRYRRRQDGVVLHDRVHPSFTESIGGDELFSLVTVDVTGGLDEFLERVRERLAVQKDYFGAEYLRGRDDLLYITCLPWVSFTHISHTMKLDRIDSVPRLSWGKYFEDGTRTMLPYSVQVNHAFVDGIHIGRFFDALRENFEGLSR